MEDGSFVENANSYVTEAELQTYADDRGTTITETDLTILLIQSMDYIESKDFIGQRIYPVSSETASATTQALQWPRYNAYVDLFYIGTSTIPQLLKDSQIEAALAVDRGINELSDLTRLVDNATADTLTVQFVNNGQAATINRMLNAKLHKLLSGSNSGISFSVSRG